MVSLADRIIEIIRKNQDKIKEHLQNKREIEIVTENLEEELLQNKEISDSELFSLTDKGIKLAEMQEDIFKELKELIPKEVEKTNLSGVMLKLCGNIQDFPCLKENISNEYFDLKNNSLEEEVSKIIKLKFPTAGKLGELFEKEFVVDYAKVEQLKLNMIFIYDRRIKKDSFLLSNAASFDLEKSEDGLEFTKKIKEFRVEMLSIEDIALFLEWFQREGFEVNNVTIKVENIDITNISLLEKYAKNFNILIDYGEFKKTTYEDFVGMREAIDWYKEIIQSSNLSPFEQLIFAYDILKTFPYIEAENSDDARYVPNIIKTGKIVCVGYSKLLEMIINELGIRSVSCVIPAKEGEESGHQRVAVRLDDEKYDIHGIFSVDATWDRDRSELSLIEDTKGSKIIRLLGREEGDKIIKEYDSLSLYSWFLIPYKQYKEVYFDEKIPDIFNFLDENSFGYDTFEACSFEFEKLFDKLDRNYIKDYILNSQKPSLECFKKALAVVREAEGYITNEIIKVVEDTVELNQMLDDCSLFFQEEDKINKK